MTAGISPVKKGKAAWLKSVLARAALAATFFMLLACGAGNDTGAATSRPGEASGEVHGLVVEITGRNIVELETLGIRDEDGTVWTFTADGPLEFSPSHLREHQLFGDTVTVSYVRRGELLLVVAIGD